MILLHNIDFHIDMLEPIKQLLIEKGIYKSPDWSTKGIHFGNYCLVNIPDNLLPDIMALQCEDKYGNKRIQYRNRKTIINPLIYCNLRRGIR